MDLYSLLLLAGDFRERIEEFANKTIEDVKAELDYYINKESVSKEDGEKVLELMMVYHVFKTYLEYHDEGFAKMTDVLFGTQEEAKDRTGYDTRRE